MQLGQSARDSEPRDLTPPPAGRGPSSHQSSNWRFQVQRKTDQVLPFRKITTRVNITLCFTINKSDKGRFVRVGKEEDSCPVKDVPLQTVHFT